MVAGLLALLTAVLVVKRRRNTLLTRYPGPPSYRPWPVGLLLGQFPLFFGGRTPPFLLQWAERYGHVYAFESPLQTSRVVITDVEMLKDILVRQAYNFEKPKFMVGPSPDCRMSAATGLPSSI